MSSAATTATTTRRQHQDYDDHSCSCSGPAADTSTATATGNMFKAQAIGCSYQPGCPFGLCGPPARTRGAAALGLVRFRGSSGRVKYKV